MIASRWLPIQTGYALVLHVGHLLVNHDERDGAGLRQAYQDQVRTPRRAYAAPDVPRAAVAVPFAKVSASDWPDLFHCYDVPSLPRTNNELEQYFGAAPPRTTRHRRKMASPTWVAPGAVRKVALIATRPQPPSADDFRLRDLGAWKALRPRTETRHKARRVQARFRRNAASYLATLEAQLLNPALPPLGNNEQQRGAAGNPLPFA